MRSRPPVVIVAFVALATVATFTSACGKQAADPPPPPRFEPGALTQKPLAAVGGVTIELPDNLKISESEGAAKLEAEGFPTVTITRTTGEFDGTGTRVSTSGGKLEARYTIPTAEWSCTAEDVGDHEELIIAICESITAPPNPNVSKLTCKTVTGFDAEPVNAAWAATAEAFATCFSSVEQSGVSFGFNLELDGPARNFTKYTSPMIRDDAAKACTDAIYDGLERDPALTKEGLESGQIECDGSYSRY